MTCYETGVAEMPYVSDEDEEKLLYNYGVIVGELQSDGPNLNDNGDKFFLILLYRIGNNKRCFEILNKLEVAFCPNRENHENLIRVKEKLPNVFQDGNSENLESIFQSVRELEILSGVGDCCEIPDVIKNLRKDIKILQIQRE